MRTRAARLQPVQLKTQVKRAGQPTMAFCCGPKAQEGQNSTRSPSTCWMPRGRSAACRALRDGAEEHSLGRDVGRQTPKHCFTRWACLAQAALLARASLPPLLPRPAGSLQQRPAAAAVGAGHILRRICLHQYHEVAALALNQVAALASHRCRSQGVEALVGGQSVVQRQQGGHRPLLAHVGAAAEHQHALLQVLLRQQLWRWMVGRWRSGGWRAWRGRGFQGFQGLRLRRPSRNRWPFRPGNVP